MTLLADQLPITSPCPVDLDPALSDGSRRSWHCGQCDKRVHVLSSMTEDEARTFLAERDGQNLCVTYLEAPDGTIKFRQPPPPRLIPANALTPRRLAVGLGLALAACTPIEPPPAPRATTVEVRTEETKPAPTKDDTKLADLVEKYKSESENEPEPKPEPKPEPEPEPEPERFIPRPGGIVARPLPPHVAPPTTASAEAEPCDPPKSTPHVVKRGDIGPIH